MSDSESNNTVVPDNVLSIPSVVRTISQILNAEVGEDILIPLKKKGGGTCAMANINTPKNDVVHGAVENEDVQDIR